MYVRPFTPTGHYMYVRPSHGLMTICMYVPHTTSRLYVCMSVTPPHDCPYESPSHCLMTIRMHVSQKFSVEAQLEEEIKDISNRYIHVQLNSKLIRDAIVQATCPFYRIGSRDMSLGNELI